MRPVLSVQNLGAHFGDRHILNDINFDILPNQIFVLMGPGGAGKSTILRTICAVNVAQPNATFSGSILYLGQPVSTEHSPTMVVQKAHLLLGTVFENLREQSPCRTQLSALELRQNIIQSLNKMNLHELATKLDCEMLDLTVLQRKQVMIAGALREKPALLCLDEPTADLNDQDAAQLLQLIRHISQNHAILFVTHNQIHAREIGDHIALVAGGRIQEAASIDTFFNNPISQPARDYVRTGGCSVPSLNVRPEDLEPDYTEIFAREKLALQTQPEDDDPPRIEISNISDGPTTEPGLITDTISTDDSAEPVKRVLPFGWIRQNKTPSQTNITAISQDNQPPLDDASDADILSAVKAVFDTSETETTNQTEQINQNNPPLTKSFASERRGPRNFRWLRPGVLAGTPKPGLLVDIAEDFQSLQRVGVTHLITLTEEPLNNPPLEEFNIKNIHFPIVDMEPPTIEDAAQLCTTVAELIDQGATIAYHCHAGIGRTGTMLVAQLIWEGMDDKTALATARNLYNAWVQSTSQEEFLADFHEWVDAQETKTARLSPKIMTSTTT